MGNLLDCDKKYDIIKDCANDRYREALGAIHTRLLKWAGLASYQFRSNEYREEHSEWLDRTEELFRVLKDFRRVIGLKDQDQVVKGKLSKKDDAGNTIDVSIDKSIRNWQCGMCQMIDIREESICEVLPVLLTAYVYNFPDNTFVHQFLERNPVERGHTDEMTECLYGAKRYSNPNWEDDDDDDDDKKPAKFELLMFEVVTDRPKNRKMIKQLSKCFRFRNFSPYSTKDNFMEPKTFVLPESIRKDFVKNCVSLNNEQKIIGINFLHKWKEPPAGFDFYNKQTLLMILGYFYTSICKFAKQENSSFAKKPNPLFCWMLINQEIHDGEELKCIQKNCNQYSEEILHKYYDDIIRAEYTGN